MTFDSISAQAAQLEACLEVAQHQTNLGNKVREALVIIHHALEQYGEERISLSFNGGKDCTVLLHLYAAALYDLHRTRPEIATSAVDDSPQPLPTIPALYIAPPSPFSKLESFISESERRYNLSLFRESGAAGMKHALQAYKDALPTVEAILIGIRRTDPHGGKLATSNPTDPDWPQFIRIHPILGWSYSDVWSFLRSLDIPYCHLYDIGYTSLGSTYNTFPNPALLIEEDQENQNIVTTRRYKPAYELQDEQLERAGRGPSISSDMRATVDGSPAETRNNDNQASIRVSDDAVPSTVIGNAKSISSVLPVPPSSALPTPAPSERSNPTDSLYPK